MEALLENAERSDMVATNIGKVPIEDYREIVAVQNGFDSYDEMYNKGIRIGNGYDKEPEPIVPAWEKKKKEKVKSFDLHPDVPMAERNNFDLRSNPVEQVGKKERFRRNAEAIRVSLYLRRWYIPTAPKVSNTISLSMQIRQMNLMRILPSAKNLPCMIQE